MAPRMRGLKKRIQPPRRRVVVEEEPGSPAAVVMEEEIQPLEEEHASPPAVVTEEESQPVEEEQASPQAGVTEEEIRPAVSVGEESPLPIVVWVASAENVREEKIEEEVKEGDEEGAGIGSEQVDGEELDGERVVGEGESEGVREEEGEREGKGEEVESEGEGEVEREGEGEVERDGDGEEELGEESGGSSRTVSDAMEEETIAIAPMGMYFPPSEYNKKIKISTRCFMYEALQTLENLKDNKMEMKWFQKHPQFRHIFHMPKDRNHKVMGMWMLLLRTACIEKLKEVWFLVNGIPIRYGIREHALLSGLNCRNYPLGFREMGSMGFVRKYFETGSTIRYHDVKAKLEEMEPSVDRLKMAILYFLSSIIIGQTKVGKDAPSVDPFFLRAVNDLQLCKTFPWGRLSFEYMLKQIAHTMSHFGGMVKGVLWPIPGFCIPMELLAFEAIPQLGMKFRERCLDAEDTCPRMCKSAYKKSEMKGFPLSRINEELGTTKDIQSILTPVVGEENLLHKMTEKDDDDDKHDVVVDSWMKRLKEGNHVWFEQMYKDDLAGRVAVDEAPASDAPALLAPASDAPALVAPASEVPQSSQLTDLIVLVTTMKASVEGRLQQLEAKMDRCEERLQELEGLGMRGRGKRARKE